MVLHSELLISIEDDEKSKYSGPKIGVGLIKKL